MAIFLEVEPPQPSVTLNAGHGSCGSNVQTELVIVGSSPGEAPVTSRLRRMAMKSVSSRPNDVQQATPFLQDVSRLWIIRHFWKAYLMTA
jgi:hypothetical protein